MSAFELLPILGGFALGLFLSWMKPAARPRVGPPIALALAVLATVASGELWVSWFFLVVDGALVAGAAAVTFLAFHRWGRARAGGEVLASHAK
jgi:hypothetical protein